MARWSSFYKDVFGFTPSDAGYVISLYGVGAFVGSWLGGVLTDDVARRMRACRPTRTPGMRIDCSM